MLLYANIVFKDDNIDRIQQKAAPTCKQLFL